MVVYFYSWFSIADIRDCRLATLSLNRVRVLTIFVLIFVVVGPGALVFNAEFLSIVAFVIVQELSSGQRMTLLPVYVVPDVRASVFARERPVELS